MDRFLSRHNVDRYRRLTEPALSDAERRCLLDLLAVEASLLRQDARLGRLPYEHGAGPASRADANAHAALEGERAA